MISTRIRSQPIAFAGGRQLVCLGHRPDSRLGAIPAEASTPHSPAQPGSDRLTEAKSGRPAAGKGRPPGHRRLARCQVAASDPQARGQPNRRTWAGLAHRGHSRGDVGCQQRLTTIRTARVQMHRLRASGHRSSGRGRQLRRYQRHGRVILTAAPAIEAHLQTLKPGIHLAMLESGRASYLLTWSWAG
jgi:hypothetical protein